LEVVSVTGAVASFHHSEWIHVDALQAWSDVEAFDERHWDLIDKAVELAASAGVDTLFTPVLTPPIDVDPTSPPLATQLVVVHRQGDRWSLDFDRLDRWSRIARRHGITHLEFSHLFCQGEVDRPADVYDANGNHLFGSHLSTEGYRDFLAILLPALDQWSRRHGWSDALYWHVSDEPRANQYTSYRKAVDMVRR
ncbi:neuraminidase NanP, partial [Actinomadura sp. DSM 109109]|nr:neuraminidase NanP [Actinomadura lepetitiana]